MDDQLEMDASGCWVLRKAQVISKTPLHSDCKHYNRQAYSRDVKDNVDNDEQDEFLIIR